MLRQIISHKKALKLIFMACLVATLITARLAVPDNKSWQPFCEYITITKDFLREYDFNILLKERHWLSVEPIEPNTFDAISNRLDYIIEWEIRDKEKIIYHGSNLDYRDFETVKGAIGTFLIKPDKKYTLKIKITPPKNQTNKITVKISIKPSPHAYKDQLLKNNLLTLSATISSIYLIYLLLSAVGWVERTRETHPS